MERIVGIDYGKKRTGIAISDPLTLFASPLTTLPSEKVVEYLKEFREEKGISRFVVGYPMNLDNTPSEGAKFVEQFLNLLKKHFSEIPVNLVDERFTSKMAFQAMIDGGVKKSGRREKGMVDKISAAIILQSYIDSQKIKRES